MSNNYCHTILCHCGKPLHYSDEQTLNNVQKLIDEFGEYMTITSLFTGKKFKVPRHYVALHGVKGDRLESYGFEEIT